MKLALGTVQFGLEYGVSNTSGMVSDAQLESILVHAHQQGIYYLDTAISYGTSEQRLGQLDLSQFGLITKVPPLEKIKGHALSDLVDESLARLNQDSLQCLMLHQGNDLLGPEGPALYYKMQAEQAAGKTRYLGVSIYNPEEARAIIKAFNIDYIQLPYNLFDQRFAVSGLLDLLADKGVKVHARSIFLQGLLLMPASERPPYFEPWQACFTAYDQLLSDQGLSALSGCLAFVTHDTRIEVAVVGCLSQQQLREITQATSPIAGFEFGSAKSQNFLAEAKALSVDKSGLIDPRLWQT